jgi:hypothetical protein
MLPPLTNIPLSFDDLRLVRHQDTLASSLFTVTSCRRRETKTLPNRAQHHLQPVDASSVVRKGVLKTGEPEHVAASPIRLLFKHQTGESSVKQMHQDKMVELEMLPIFMQCKLAEHS